MSFFAALSALGWTLGGLAILMMAPVLVAFGYGEHHQGWSFIVASGLSLFAGGTLVIGTRQRRYRSDPRETFVLAVLVWAVVPVFGAMPFHFIGVTSGVADAYFEAMSGFTTTGATVIGALDAVERSVLVWRALLNWFGGFSTLMLVLVLFSFYSTGTMLLFRTAMPRGERNDLRRRLLQALKSLWWIYAGLTGVAGIALLLAGVPFLDSACLAMSTISTGGFMTRDDGLASFSTPLVEAILIVFMVAGAVNFTFHWSLIRGRGVGIYRDDPEVRLLTGIGVGAGIAFAAAMMAEGTSFGGALRAGLFSSFSMLTTTGFVVDPGIAAGSTLVVPMGLMVLALIGGATGSTAGGIKLLRFWLLLKLMLREVHRAPHPRSIVRIVYAGHFVDDSPLRGTLAFFAAYLLSIAFVGIGLAAVGVDFGAAVTSAAAAISNTGPAGDLAGGAVATGLGGSSGRIGEFYAGMPDAAKWILSGAMLLGRLEIFALLALVAAVFRRN